MRARHLAIVGLVSSAAAAAACSAILGDFDTGGAPGSGEDGGDARTDAGGDAGGNPGDATFGGDGPASSEAGCVPFCADPSTLNGCVEPPYACSFECMAVDGGAKCTQIHPTPPVDTFDLALPGTTDVTLTTSTRFAVETGAIDNLRPPNKDPLTPEVSSGIGFRLAKASTGVYVGIWSFKSLTVEGGVTVRFTAGNPAALVAASALTVAGILDARGYDVNGKLCVDGVSGPGGGAGGVAGKNGAGAGAGKAATPSTAYSGGPSGGAFGGTGGAGGAGSNAATNPGAAAAAAYGAPALSPILAGSGGGGAYAAGGGGGGAIQLVAGTRVVIGGGAAVGGVNAGGCNGHGGVFGSAGSAGGSGGAILIEAPALDMKANGVLAANGGGGATGGGAADPTAGQLSSNPAFGAIINGYGYGGNGGAGTTANGGNGTAAPVGASGAGGAGGGAVGHVRINNRSGSFTPPTPASVSPALGLPAPTNPPSTVGVLDVR
jgi:hypothetical protein